ncbi:nicotinate-nucleotide adenylyltransferase [Pseudoalteromonas shioyasakiensis]|uniref:nicotinate-nucleotide adenylyltransferase n=1 Tax=Pseudoalteromonas TaxID=53246 RepID=UPI000C941044|nr:MULTISPECIES: nicotinate-nucleotide adenylyltransferase [Pseudoalteromonas]MAD02132.1 nicotinate-nicotinamide nucleotide adenylyltransferase [Pseudoalteromonas sp.]MCG9710407.1 nicotinate-nucleotide adenylyltransferase [Pseudoalteromonas sp. Isolate3]MCP4587493.1 nicotinate-nucleotide adenylyltransferase [Pseudoalteromonas sp.]MCQ8881846.1 nicotinate-nucleotide adenylyltransferase [Pseudoalteromonas shioyasakiensis]NIZ05871.1 nicotinate-nucleotide adenylyltransferase [Pseudoalteromonas sp. |tara:strand:+ start:4072 stop:4707 length:636 start_codon:yes stop_codon:yes gene_type:complete
MIAIFGGTFDPIHLGHINMAQQCVQQCQLDTLYFMPCAIPAHKAKPGISDEHRINMLKLAIENNPHFAIDYRELNREGASYSLLSLKELRAENPSSPIMFLIGMDSFNSLDKWFKWQEIVELCHIVVYQRPGQHCQVSGELAVYKENAFTEQLSQLQQTHAGKLFFLDGLQVNAASSEIRKKLHLNDNIAELLPTTVSQYIAQHHLYQTDE